MKNFITLLVIISILGFSSWKLIRGHTRFHDIQNWPHVPATIIQSDSTTLETLSGARYSAQKTSTIDAGSVLFSYVVDGKTYRSNLARPDGGSPPVQPYHYPYKAYYNPNYPDIAVLSPTPYQGGLWVITATASFIALAMLVFVTFFIPNPKN